MGNSSLDSKANLILIYRMTKLRLCTLETMSQTDSKGLHEKMKALMKCFPFNSKSIEMLQESLNMSVINDIHLLNRSSNRMAGFLNDCIQASNIIPGFLEKNISGSIQLLTQNLLLVISLRQL